MVSTRKHKQDFSPPELGTSPQKSPSKSKSSTTPTSASTPSPTDENGSANGSTLVKRSKSASRPNWGSSTAHHAKWAHTPTHLTLVWLAVAIPLVVWDTIYILGRPHTMPGGWMHRPLWIPYALYTEVDYVYGWPAFNTQDGWPSAQGFLNALETAAYIWYMWMLWRWGVEEKGKSKGRGRKSKTEEAAVWMWERRRVEGLHGAQMVLVLSVTSWITVSKTVLYWLIEYFNGYAHIGHNSLGRLFWLWVVPNGLWLIFPSVIIYSTSKDILHGLSLAAGVQTPPSKPALL